MAVFISAMLSPSAKSSLLQGTSACLANASCSLTAFTSLVCRSRCVSYIYYAIKSFIFEQASADKIIREIGMFGPDFERYEQVQAELDAAEAEKEKEAEIAATPADKSKAKKGKIIAKSTGLKYQFQIMESINIPRAEIKKFADPLHWLTVFPPIAIVRPVLSSNSTPFHGL